MLHNIAFTNVLIKKNKKQDMNKIFNDNAIKVNELEKRVIKLEKLVAQLVAIETNKQREFEAYEEFERLRDEASSQIGHDM
ncbi:MAG: hypothetical protein M0R46_11415 [Candidatus Muirbacterium halophilum]|nr:hypothetical protein [Candidatus Muirbacterium halophilum]